MSDIYPHRIIQKEKGSELVQKTQKKRENVNEFITKAASVPFSSKGNSNPLSLSPFLEAGSAIDQRLTKEESHAVVFFFQ